MTFLWDQPLHTSIWKKPHPKMPIKAVGTDFYLIFAKVTRVLRYTF